MKIIVGILRDSQGQIDSYEKRGYHIENLDKHVQIFGSKLQKELLSKVQVSSINERPRLLHAGCCMNSFTPSWPIFILFTGISEPIGQCVMLKLQ